VPQTYFQQYPFALFNLPPCLVASFICILWHIQHFIFACTFSLKLLGLNRFKSTSSLNVMSSNDIHPSVHKHTGYTRLLKAGACSLAGLGYAMNEAAFRLEVTVGSILIISSLFLPMPLVERLILIGSVFLVLIVEVLNSAIEALVDDISLEHRALAKQAKDMGSAAVFIALVNCGICWASVIYTKW